MRVSVIIPAHNEELNIGRCLDALLNQVEPPDEIVVIDNNSTDKTASAARDKGVRVVKELEQGIAYARNRGYSSASGDIIARCDADTIVPTNWIKKIKENFKRRKIDALAGPVNFYDSPIDLSFFKWFYFFSLRLIQGGETLIGANSTVTKKIWNKIKIDVCTDSAVHEDIDLALHIAQAGGKTYRDNSLTVQASGRRMLNNPFSFFVTYPIMLIRTLWRHRK